MVVGGLGILASQWYASSQVFGFLFGGFSQSHAQEKTALPPAVVTKMIPVYLARLDAWVSDGAKLSEIDDRLVKTCGELIFATASAKDQTSFTTTQDGREEYDVRVDICVKLTITRAIPQDVFKDPKIVRLACRDMVPAHAVYADLCARANLKS
jgi:hypothetical protein